MNLNSLHRSLGVVVAAAAVVLLAAGCTKDEIGGGQIKYLPQISEDAVLNNLQVAYRERSKEEYAKLLGEGFQFYFDSATRNQLGLPEYWTRLEDSTRTARLFESPDVTDIDIELQWTAGSASPAGISGVDWTKLFVLDVFLDVDLAPTVENPEGITYRVENQQQRFYFRKGRTDPPSDPADTLVYLVEWRDQGATSAPGPIRSFSAAKAR